MDKIEEVVNELGLQEFGDFDGETFIATMNSSDEFSNVYSEISDKYEVDDDTGEFNDSKSMTVFTSDEIEIIANADYDNDNYTISIGRK